ncbi:ABC transporter substrate-binding protein [Mediterraneibacter gnavus]|uniref:ABC transporter substrate-binding protein n=1 Tax=Mediterraneibacter gnavus TaxID=33038 RepID=UPI000E53B1C1|nr:ABC transporter substrate-binding protein [Mediterraneibacter gnavus]
MKKKALACLLAAVMALSLAACGSGSDNKKTSEKTESQDTNTSLEATNQLIEAEDPSALPETAAKRKDTLIAGVADFAGVFNPVYWEANEDMQVVSATNASLSVNDDKGEIVDGTASMSVSEDGKVYTYKLTKEKYNDGSDVKAEDYVNWYKVVADPSYDGYQDISKVNVVGYDDYKNGSATEISGIKVVDESTIEITLEAANTSAPYVLGSAVPISTAKYGDLIKKGDLSKFKSLNMVDYVSNGAYVLKEYKEKTSATLEANPNFYLGEPKTKNLIFKVVATNAELQAVETGDVDIHDQVVCDDDHIEEAMSAGFINLKIQPTLGYGYVATNQKNEIFQDVKVRQALLHAIDRKSLNQAVYGQYAITLNIPQAPISWLYDDEGMETYDYDLEKAAELLKEAGWEKDGDKLMKDGKQMKIVFSAMSGNVVTDTMIPLMIDAYGQLGIDFQAEYVDWPTLQSKSQNGTFDMLFMAWGLTADPDLTGTFASAEAGGTQNRTGYANPELDKMLAEALASTSQDEQKEKYKEIYKLINEELPLYPIYERCNLICYNTRVQNIEQSSYVKWYQQDKIVNIEVE